MYGLKNVVALIGGLLLLSQSAAGAAVPPPTYALTCADVSAFGFPLKKDCEAALAKIQPGKPEICLAVFLTEDDYVQSGTCTIHTYNAGGKAHCLDRDLIIKGVKAILAGCTSKTQGYPPEEYTGGQYQWSMEKGKETGVRLIKTPPQ